MDPADVLEKCKTYAVVGATQNKEKFGYQIFKTLLNYDKIAYPVNPRYRDIDGIICYPSIAEIPDKPEVVVSVVPPQVTDKLIDECKAGGITIMWLQPGTYNDENLQKCNERGIEVVSGACIMVKLRTHNP